MRKSKFSETQIVGILKGAEAGVAVNDLLRTHGISRAPFFKWRSKYGGASVSDLTRLRELEAENANLVTSDVAFGFFMPMLSMVVVSFRAVPLGQLGCHPPPEHGLWNLAEGDRIDLVNLYFLS